jgi:hypothetical protein
LGTGESHSAAIFVIVFTMIAFEKIENSIIIFIKTTRVCKLKETWGKTNKAGSIILRELKNMLWSDNNQKRMILS